MSAYICDDAHISYIVQAGIKFQAWVNLGPGFNYMTRENAQNVFEILKRENVRSVNHRYQEQTPATRDHVGRFVWRSQVFDPVQVMKAVNCLEYQSCEPETWEKSLALAVCRAIKEAAIRALPGYDAAAWGNPERVAV